MQNIYRAAGAASMLLAAALTVACGPTSGSASSGTGSGAGRASVATPPLPLSETDFEPVCQGTTVSRAAHYDKTAKSGHKVVYFAPYEDHPLEQSFLLPKDWQVTPGAGADSYAAVDLVACTERTADKFLRTCTGYQATGKPGTSTARLHTATYKLSVHEASTGTELGSTTLDAGDTECPLSVTFKDNADTVEYYNDPATDQVVAFIKKYAQP
jgi:hypothetical protein